MKEVFGEIEAPLLVDLPGVRELHFMSFAFDGAHERWLTTLMVGGTLVILFNLHGRMM